MELIIDLQNTLDAAEIPPIENMQKWVKCALDCAEFKQANVEITVRVVSAEESQQLNSTYRHKDKPTNVLSFPFEAPPQVPCDLLGDLVICQSVVEQEALIQQKKLMHHWAHMLIHGTLHLIGYDHIDAADAESMEVLEISILDNFAIPSPYS